MKLTKEQEVAERERTRDKASDSNMTMAKEAVDNFKKIKKDLEDKIAFMKKIGLYEEVAVEACWERTGKAPVTVRWVETLKAEGVRSRLVARDFKERKDKDREDLFAPPPPLEAKRMLISRAATRKAGR